MDSVPSVLKGTITIKPQSTVQVTVAQASVANSKPNVEFQSHADTCVAGDNCFTVYWLMSLVVIQDGYKQTKSVNAPVCYDDPHSGYKYILMINQATQISGTANPLLCLMQCH